jgi:carboxymethylenebutenolidase
MIAELHAVKSGAVVYLEAPRAAKRPGFSCGRGVTRVFQGMAVINKHEVEIAVAGQRAEAFLYQPASATRPGVLLLPDIKCVRPVYHAQAERLAGEGFAVLLPNVFYRSGALPTWEFPFNMAEERTMKRMQELKTSLTADAQIADARAYVDFLSALPGVSKGPMGVVGYCFTGSMAVRVAAACPERIHAAASFHGGNLHTDQPDSPHLLLPRVRAALHFGHAYNDKSMTAEAIAKLEDALRAWGGKFESKVYGHAAHGWTNPDVPIYDREQAEAAFAALLSLLRGALA